MINCPVCKGKLKLSKLLCEGCDLVMEGNFNLPRVARLAPEHRILVEQMILCGGNLKDLAVEVGVSYPTLRRKVDEMIAELKSLKNADDAAVSSILDGMEKGAVKADEGIRKVKEIQGEI